MRITITAPQYNDALGIECVQIEFWPLRSEFGISLQVMSAGAAGEAGVKEHVNRSASTSVSSLQTHGIGYARSPVTAASDYLIDYHGINSAFDEREMTAKRAGSR